MKTIEEFSIIGNSIVHCFTTRNFSEMIIKLIEQHWTLASDNSQFGNI